MRSRRIAWVLLLLILMLGAALRLSLAYFVFASTRDTSVVALMGMDILEGARPLFYYGQAYMGAFEAYFVAAAFRLFGPSPEVLVLAPTCFALAWAAASFFLFRIIFGTAAGLAAALYISCCGLITVWYTMGAYGGYPEAYLLGTIAILTALKVKDENSFVKRTGLYAFLAVVFALGLWINFQILPYFILAGGVLLYGLFQRGSSRKQVPALVGTCLIGSLGLLPGLVVSQDIAGVEHMSISPWMIVDNMHLLVTKVLGKMIWWPGTEGKWLKVLIVACLLGPVVMYIVTLRRELKNPGKMLPLLFVVVFLVMYLPHQLASKAASRYLISSCMMLSCAGFATLVSAKSRYLRLTGWGCVFLWAGYNVVSLSLYCIEKYPEKLRALEIRQEAVVTAKDAGLKNVKILGDMADGLLGANLSFQSGGEVRAITARDERLYKHHLAWNSDDDGGYAFRSYWKDAVRGSLAAMEAKGRYSKTDFYTFLYDLIPSFRQWKSIPYSVVQSPGNINETAAMGDKRLSTALSIEKGDSLVLLLDLLETVPVGGMRVFPEGESPLPSGPYSISGSTDGLTYFPLKSGEVRVGASYRSGNRIYFMDHFAASDFNWPVKQIRFLKVELHNRSRLYVPKIAELLVFEDAGRTGHVSVEEVELLRDYLDKQQVVFAWCDRWLSEKLRGFSQGRSDQGEDVLLPANGRYLKTMEARKLLVKSKEAVVVANSMAQPSLQLIHAAVSEKVKVTSMQFTHYTVIVVKQPLGPADVLSGAPELQWNGHMVFYK